MGRQLSDEKKKDKRRRYRQNKKEIEKERKQQCKRREPVSVVPVPVASSRMVCSLNQTWRPVAVDWVDPAARKDLEVRQISPGQVSKLHGTDVVPPTLFCLQFANFEI